MNIYDIQEQSELGYLRYEEVVIARDKCIGCKATSASECGLQSKVRYPPHRGRGTQGSSKAGFTMCKPPAYGDSKKLRRMFFVLASHSYQT